MERDIEKAKIAAKEVKIAQQREIELAKVEAGKIAKENEFEFGTSQSVTRKKQGNQI